ncbi:hypothetical protein CIHG_01261 [Coccidioides immitis H538.4]|uniref:Uncharacterized protein n=3 Tax=Coccidioides immitis TaxID=5501 RepID=A0A0J8QNH0_COCIT|nr:hypothetical protein CIRG_01111 [Coccidioides immitis RMSCC 2394]KMU72793.1 hypothetical protein CISG_03227 [Coccidioides immitis RMSCC 3703]KMU83479.1 hypothetical protein CIHG_01261 [Coccidioides immitis H538.4]
MCDDKSDILRSGSMTLILVMYEKGREEIYLRLWIPRSSFLLSASDRRCRVMETYCGGSTGCRPQSQALQPQEIISAGEVQLANYSGGMRAIPVGLAENFPDLLSSPARRC